MRRRLSELTAGGAQVLIVLTPPPAPPPDCLDNPTTDFCRKPEFTRADPSTGLLNHHYRILARQLPRVSLVSMSDLVCPRRRCPVLLHGELPRWDGIHLTEKFSRKIAPTLIARAERAGVRFRARRPSPSTRADARSQSG